MTSPRDAHRLVGHSSPQPEAGSSAAGAAPFDPAAEDIVGRMHFEATNSDHCKGIRLLFLDAVTELERLQVKADSLEGHRRVLDHQEAEIDRLRCALRAVRACTDPQWQAQLISDALRETKP